MKTTSLKFLLSLFCIAFYIQEAKGQAYSKGSVYLSGGIGIGTIALIGADKSSKTIGPYFLKGEYALNEQIGIGLNLSYFHSYGDLPIFADTLTTYWTGYKDYAVIGYYDGMTIRSYAALLRLNVHSGMKKIFDPYFGLGIGYRGGRWYRSYGQWSTKGVLFPVGFAPSVGARVFFMETLAVFGEVGLEKSLVQAGITYKFKRESGTAPQD